MNSTGKYNDRTIYLRLLRQTRPYWFHIIFYCALDFLANVFTLLSPIPLKLAVDNVVGSQPLPHWITRILPESFLGSKGKLLIFVIGLLVALRLIDLGHSIFTSLVRMYTSEKLLLDFRGKLFEHAQRLSLGYHDEKGAIDSTSRIQNDAPSIQYIIIDGIIPFLSATVMVVTMICIMLRLDWQMALVALAVSPIFLFSSQFFRKRLRHRSRELKALDAKSVSIVQEVLAGLRVVKAFGQEEREHGRFVETANQGIRLRARLMLTEGAFSMLIGLTTAAGTAAVLYVGVRHIQMGVLTLGTLLLLMTYLSQLYAPLKTIGRKIASLQTHFASIERAFTLLDAPNDVPDRPDARSLDRASGAVAFEDVHFGYDGRRPVLMSISFDVESGTRVAIAGTTGAGKTTLVSLLTRFYDPSAGRILLDGIDLRDYKLADLRRQFAIVLQDPLLFSTTIMENIAYSRPQASEEQIIAAARAANAHEFIERLPDGYQTLVGERGMTLSGGERQRISLARAFLRDAPILILDEPTSSVDMRTEAVIVEAMERLMEGRTTFIIAHRLSTLRSCDVLLVVEKGRLKVDTPDVSAAIDQLAATALDG